MSGSWNAGWCAAIVACFALSALVTSLAIRYARRRDLFDLPGQRRSHSTPTPRGGGIGIVVASIFACALVGIGGSVVTTAQVIAAIVIVATAGWIDDHRGLGARWRLLAHFVAATLLLIPLFASLHAANAGITAATLGVLFAIAAVACAWSINLHNFMDGINGLLALQAIFVFCAIAVCEVHVSGTPRTTLLLLWVAAVAGFVPFNFPRARIFMGDVGSGVLGLLVAAAVVWQMAAHDAAALTGIIACSAFVTDATCTLLSRMARGRRWYSAHHEHLFQWLARSGFSHKAVVAMYMGWNLCVVVPVLYLANRDFPASRLSAAPALTTEAGIGHAIAVYALAIAVWFAGKRWCLQKVKNAITPQI